jgi:cell division septal protein FtsQ
VNVEEMAALRTGAEIKQLLPYAEAEIRMMQKGIINGVMMDINSGKLTADAALQRWIEYVASERLLQRFNQKGRMISTTDTSEMDRS